LRHGHRDRILRCGHRIGFGGVDIGTGFVVVGMADVESAVAHVFTGIRRGGLRCRVFWP